MTYIQLLNVFKSILLDIDCLKISFLSFYQKKLQRMI